MNKTFIKEMLTGIGNVVSSKRVALFIFIFAFLGENVMWYFFAKPPNPTLGDELFYTLTGLIVAVFGERAIPLLRKAKDALPPDPPEDNK